MLLSSSIISPSMIAPVVGTGKGGYGRCSKFDNNTLAHRFTYAWLVKSLPKGRGKHIPVVDHICKNRRCCNPIHLRLISDAENLAISDAPATVNKRKVYCIRGHLLPKARAVGRNKKLMRTCKVCKKLYDRQRYIAKIKR